MLPVVAAGAVRMQLARGYLPAICLQHNKVDSKHFGLLVLHSDDTTHYPFQTLGCISMESFNYNIGDEPYKLQWF